MKTSIGEAELRAKMEAHREAERKLEAEKNAHEELDRSYKNLRIERDAIEKARETAVKTKEDQATLLAAQDIVLKKRDERIDELAAQVDVEKKAREEALKRLNEVQAKAVEEFRSSLEYSEELHLGSADSFILEARDLVDHLRRFDANTNLHGYDVHLCLTSEEEKKAKKEREAQFNATVKESTVAFMEHYERQIEQCLLGEEPAPPSTDEPASEAIPPPELSEPIPTTPLSGVPPSDNPQD